MKLHVTIPTKPNHIEPVVSRVAFVVMGFYLAAGSPRSLFAALTADSDSCYFAVAYSVIQKAAGSIFYLGSTARSFLPLLNFFWIFGSVLLLVLANPFSETVVIASLFFVVLGPGCWVVFEFGIDPGIDSGNEQRDDFSGIGGIADVRGSGVVDGVRICGAEAVMNDLAELD